MPQYSVNQIKSPATFLASDSDSINSTCGDEELNMQAYNQSQIVEFQH